MILTVTLNPAVDKIIILDSLELGELNRVKDTSTLAGGKGINVSEVLTELGKENIALGIVGGSNGKIINDFLTDMEVKSDFSWSKNNTRQNLKIKEKSKNRETEINETGKIDSEDLESFKEKYDKYIKENKTVVLSGSLPDGAPDDIYAELIEKAVEEDVKAILDTSGEAFRIGLEKSPYLVKPNLEEMENLLGKELEGNEDLKEAAEFLLDKGVKEVMISLGGDGAFIASQSEAYRLYTPSVDVAQTTVGAGDTMVAGLAKEIDQNSSLKDTGVYAAALATAYVKVGSISDIDRELIEGIKNEIKVEKIY
jgi:1-phosphofructokinase